MRSHSKRKAIPLSRFARVRCAPPFCWKGEAKRFTARDTPSSNTA